MKTYIMPFLFLIFIFPSAMQAVDYVHINEIMYNTPLNEVITTPPYSNGEYIELYNAGANVVNLAGWKLMGDGVTKIYEFGQVSIPSRSFLIIAYQHSRSPEFRLSEVFPATAAYANKIIYQNKITLKNDKGYVRLYDPAGVLRDSIYYGNETSIKPIEDRLIAGNDNGIPGSQCLSVQRKRVNFNSNGSAIANHSDWHVSLAAPFALSTAYVTPNVDSQLNLSLSPGHNYTVVITPTEAVDNIEKTNSGYILSNGGKAMVTVQYYDGLGRPVQTVQQGIAPSGNDLAILTEYDSFGREYRQWLPAPVAGKNGAYTDNHNLLAGASNFYRDGNLYTETLYEPSPLNRVIGEQNPGAQFQSHPKRISYETNKTNEVKHYIVNNNNQLQCKGHYPAGTLYKTTFTDEDGNTQTEYKDKLGQLIMTRQDTDHDTYYVYDDYGNKSYVLPPLASDALNNEQQYEDTIAALKHYAYLYKYDERNRCIQKRLPGAAWIYMLYDKADRLALHQDGNQRKRYEWTYYKYDQLGRLAVTGILQNIYSHEAWRDYMQYQNVRESRINSDHGYTQMTLMGSSYMSLLTVNYYDNYDFLEIPSYISQKSTLSYAENSEYGKAFENANGLLTGTRTYLLDGSGEYLTEVYYYDYRGRVVQTCATNHMEGYDVISNQYDFAGNLTKSLNNHQGRGYKAFSAREVYTNTYDHAGRLITTKYKLDDKDEITLVRNQYDEIGRLSTKTQHDNKNRVDYVYNVRNWLMQINDGDFQQQLFYTQPANEYAATCYNGNISSMQWTYGEKTHSYNYYYDALNRLVHSYVYQPSADNFSFLLTPLYGKLLLR